MEKYKGEIDSRLLILELDGIKVNVIVYDVY
jgi:hypothetical protein